MNQREAELLAAAERLVALARFAHDTAAKIPPESIAMCLRAYDEAKKRAAEPSSFEHVLEDTSLSEKASEEAANEEAPLKEINAFTEPIPEPQTLALIHAKSEWEQALIDAKMALETCSREYEKNGLDPQAPCPADLAILYKRCFRARDVVNNLTTLIERVFAGHALKPGEGPAWVWMTRPSAAAMKVGVELFVREEDAAETE